MTIETKLKFNNDNFYQTSGDTINLSGKTIVNEIEYISLPTIVSPLTIPTSGWVTGITSSAYITGSTATYVDVAGSDITGDGTLNKPYQTIQKGVDETLSGGTVLILGDGTFSENVNSKIDVDIYAPNATLELNDGNQLILDKNKITIRRLLRTSGGGNMVIANNNNTGYSILVAYEINDTGCGNTLIPILHQWILVFHKHMLVLVNHF